MSVLVYAAQSQGSFKKKTFELVQYGAALAEKIGVPLQVLVIGPASEEGLKGLGQYGAKELVHVADPRLQHFHVRAYAKVCHQVAEQKGAGIFLASQDNEGRALAPRMAASWDAGMVAGAIALPELDKGFVLKRAVFAGKAFAYVKVNSEKKVITLMPNSFPVKKSEGEVRIEVLESGIADSDLRIKVEKTETVSGGALPLGEAERVVSGGRGMKGPENWGILEELADSLGAALACSRPVADSHWRPHHEHVGQTGGTIRPNLYIAVGISGAIQHLAGVNGSKTIVVINKDPEAPFFKAGDYGVVGDAMTVVPRLTEAVRRFRASQE